MATLKKQTAKDCVSGKAFILCKSKHYDKYLLLSRCSDFLKITTKRNTFVINNIMIWFLVVHFAVVINKLIQKGKLVKSGSLKKQYITVTFFNRPMNQLLETCLSCFSTFNYHYLPPPTSKSFPTPDSPFLRFYSTLSVTSPSLVSYKHIV